ncbi:MAG: HD domain-containing protein [Planctomycetota bacterium]|jgi:hypothetical protein
MTELNKIEQLAKRLLTISIPSITSSFLWDRAQRLLRNVELICRLPELGDKKTQIDRFCLAVAAYFSDAGIVVLVNNGRVVDSWGINGNNGDDLTEELVEFVEQNLAGVVEKHKIEKVNQIIFESNSRFTKTVEAMILSDARNLDDMGVVGIFNELRRYFIGGRNLSDALQLWKRKIDYGYWQARLESFSFESVRKIAEQRFMATEKLIEQLRAESSAQDLKELNADSALAGQESNY